MQNTIGLKFICAAEYKVQCSSEKKDRESCVPWMVGPVSIKFPVVLGVLHP